MRPPFAMAWAMAAVLGLGAGVVAQDRGAGEVETQRAQAVGRPELARAYVELERLVMERGKTMPVELLRRVNVGMDKGADAYLVGDYAVAFKRINQQVAMVDGSRVVKSGESVHAAAAADDVRAAMLARLGAAEKAHASLGAAIAACRWRVEAMAGGAMAENSYVLAAPGRMEELVAGTEGLIAKIEAGEDPFVHLRGDWLLALKVGEVNLPVRMYRDDDRAERARPLIIAVHGAGGNENLWMDGYGAGVLKDIAKEKGAIVVTPRIVPGLFTPAMFDGIVEAVAKWQDVDRSQVYVIGHSMGGGVVTAWAKLRSENIAAACSIAGVGSLAGSKKIAPMLAYAAELDGVIPAAGVRKSAESAKASGLDVEVREVANYGHVLVVGKVTREAVEWMMERKLKGDAGGWKAEGKGEK